MSSETKTPVEKQATNIPVQKPALKKNKFSLTTEKMLSLLSKGKIQCIVCGDSTDDYFKCANCREKFCDGCEYRYDHKRGLQFCSKRCYRNVHG